MDMVLCIIDKDSLKMQYAGAYNPVYIVRNGELNELKGDKMPIGIHAVKLDKQFETRSFNLEKGDMLYLFSDGYMDQFGGENGQKFKQKSFKELVLSIVNEPLDVQKEKVEQTMINWMGEHSQLDDMMIMGIKI